MRIRSKTFKQWMLRSFSKTALRDIATKGARMGCPGMLYYRDTSHLYQRFKDEIWNILVDDMKVSDYDNIFDFIVQTFSKRSKEVETKNQFEALLVWFAAEKIAREVG
ncbi:MAG: hypothetical protein AABZ06_05335 [Bdellovibrionota bacterium]